MQNDTHLIQRNAFWPFKGLNVETPSSLLDPTSTPDEKNMYSIDGLLQKRGGYYKLDDSGTAIPSDEDILEIVDYEREDDGSNELIVFTNKGQYKYSSTRPIETISSWFSASQIVSTNDLSSVINIGDPIIISGTPQNDGTYIVQAISGTAITLASSGATSSPSSSGTFTYGTKAGTWTDITCTFDSSVDSDVTISIATATTITITSTLGDRDFSHLFKSGQEITVSGATTPANNGAKTLSSDAGYATGVTTLTFAGGTFSGTIPDTVEMTAKIYWTGTRDNPVSAVVGTDETAKKIIATNNNDFVVWYDEGNNIFRPFVPTGIENFQYCNWLAIFNDLLLLGGIQTDSTLGKYLYWSDTADFDDFANGVSGFNFIADSQGDIKRLEILADRMVVYSENSITMIDFAPGELDPLSFQQIVQGTRLISGRMVTNLGPFHLYGSTENIWMFNGTITPRKMGDQVRDFYKSYLTLDNPNRNFMFNDFNKRRAFLVLERDDGSQRVLTINYDVFDPRENIWDVQELTDDVYSFGFYTDNSTTSWLDLPYATWTAWGGNWNDDSLKIAFPNRVFASDNEVYIFNDANLLDDATDFEAYYDTPDLVPDQMYKNANFRCQRLEFDAQGKEVEILYSTDEGQTFTSIKTVGLNQLTSLRYRVNLDVRARQIRFRFRSTSTGALFIRAYQVSWTEGSSR